MKSLRVLSMFVVGMLSATLGIPQEKPKAMGPRPGTPLKVQIVFTEMDGEKKIGSLPFTLLVSTEAHRGLASSLRSGLRVPIFTDKDQKLQYIDVGTNIDCLVANPLEGHYQVSLSFERSSIYSNTSIKGDKKLASAGGDVDTSYPQPIIQQVRANLTLEMRDGQTVQSVLATDPLSGRVLKVDVTLNVVK